MVISKEDIIKAIGEMTVLELVDLKKSLEEAFDVSASAMMAAAPAIGAGAAPAEEKTEFNVILLSAGDNKIATIKEVRAITGLGLSEAKAAVEAAGPDKIIKEGIPKADAEALVKKLTDLGAKAELK